MVLQPFKSIPNFTLKSNSFYLHRNSAQWASCWDLNSTVFKANSCVWAVGKGWFRSWDDVPKINQVTMKAFQRIGANGWMLFEHCSGNKWHQWTWCSPTCRRCSTNCVNPSAPSRCWGVIIRMDPHGIVTRRVTFVLLECSVFMFCQGFERWQNALTTRFGGQLGSYVNKIQLG